MKIKGLDYNVIDTLDQPVTVPDCSVAITNKTGKGHGERKLYIGPRNKMREFFGGDNFVAKCFIKKEDLLSYLDLMKEEYMHPTYNYNGKDKLPKLWAIRRKRIESFDDFIFFNVTDQGQLEGSRGYVNKADASQKENYNLLGDVCLNKYTYLDVMRLEHHQEDTLFYFKLFVDAEIAEKRKMNYPEIYGKKKQQEKPKSKSKEKKDKEIRIARRGQGKYRRLLLKECHCCPITMVDDKRLLIASHIQPWSESNDYQKIDPKNGFLFSPVYDKLFDRGLITFTDDKKIVVSNWVSPLNQKRLNLCNNKYYEELPIDEKRKKYLEYHRKYVFEKRA